MQLEGIGSSARILQPDVAACGPSVVHIIDQVGPLCLPARAGHMQACCLRAAPAQGAWHCFCDRPQRASPPAPPRRRRPQVLLPFRFDQEAIDAITGTQLANVTNPQPPAVVPAGRK